MSGANEMVEMKETVVANGGNGGGGNNGLSVVDGHGAAGGGTGEPKASTGSLSTHVSADVVGVGEGGEGREGGAAAEGKGKPQFAFAQAESALIMGGDGGDGAAAMGALNKKKGGLVRRCVRQCRSMRFVVFVSTCLLVSLGICFVWLIWDQQLRKQTEDFAEQYTGTVVVQAAYLISVEIESYAATSLEFMSLASGGFFSSPYVRATLCPIAFMLPALNTPSRARATARASLWCVCYACLRLGTR